MQKYEIPSPGDNNGIVNRNNLHAPTPCNVHTIYYYYNNAVDDDDNNVNNNNKAGKVHDFFLTH